MDVMHAIADIEQKLQDIKSSTDKLCESQQEILSAEIEKKELEKETLLAEKKEKIQRISDFECNETLNRIEGEYRKKLLYLDERYEAEKDKWVEEIFATITGCR